jgi:hypothetical protein
MIWLVWRQHRRQFMALVIGMVALAAVLIPTGRQSHHAIAAYSRCVRGLGTAAFVDLHRIEECQSARDTFTNTHEPWAYAAVLLLFLPLLIGLFWGAPLVAREVEEGTHRFAWTQGVSRTRWILTKLGLVGGVIALASVAYALLVSWWMEPLNESVTVRLDYLFFDQQGVAPVGYTLFAVALGVFAGTLTRKVLPAMAITLVAFLGTRIVMLALVRPNLADPVTYKVPVGGGTPLLPNPALAAWIQSTGVYNADGSLRTAGATQFCRPAPGLANCAGDGSYNQWTYQPGDLFWNFQWIETGIFAALAAALLYVAVLRVRRSIA